MRLFQFPTMPVWGLLLAIFFSQTYCWANPANDSFLQGVTAYQAGKFPEAAAAFEKSAQTQPAAGTFINLGLAEWQRGHAGTAILAWEKARWLNPFDRRATENLKFAHAVVQAGEPQLKWFEITSTWLPPNAWVWLAGAGLWLAIGALVVPRILRWRNSGWQQWLAALGSGIFIFSMTANIGVVSRTQIGFVVERNTPLRLTPTRDAETVSTLAAGEPARKLRTRGNYYFIQTASERGWIEQSSFGEITK